MLVVDVTVPCCRAGSNGPGYSLRNSDPNKTRVEVRMDPVSASVETKRVCGVRVGTP